MVSAAASLLCLADFNRLRILRLLLERPLTVREVVRATGLGQSLASHHLAALARGGWVAARRDGRTRIYAVIADGGLSALAAWIRREIPLTDPCGQPAAPAAPAAGDALAGSTGLEDYLL
jgi:DNA-binding transcriptional ArsR family regulator